METYRFFRQETEQWEDVAPEIWQWEAHYTDGTILKQFDDDKLFHQFKEIDQSKLSVFKMVSITGQDYTILFDPSYKLIHFYRNFILENGTVRLKAYCFGYEKSGVKVIFAIFPSGEVIITDDVEKIGVA